MLREFSRERDREEDADPASERDAASEGETQCVAMAPSAVLVHRLRAAAGAPRLEQVGCT